MSETTPPQTAPIEVEKPMWGIGFIVKTLQWLEKLTVALSAPLLTFVAVSTVANAYMNGQLLTQGSVWETVYAWCLGIGIEGQFSGTIDTAHQRQVYGLDGVWFYRFVAFLLFLVGMTTAAVVGYSEVNHVSIPEALLALNVPPLFWNWGRSVIMFGLIALSAHTRFVKPKPALSTEEELAKIEREARISAAKRRAAAERFQGFGGIVRGGIQGVTGRTNTPADVTEIPEAATAFAQENTGELPAASGVITAEPPPISGLAESGKWWDAQAYKDYVAFRYGAQNIGISLKRAAEIVNEVGGNKRIARANTPGKPSAYARVAALKKRAKSDYEDEQIPVMSGVFSPEMVE